MQNCQLLCLGLIRLHAGVSWPNLSWKFGRRRGGQSHLIFVTFLARSHLLFVTKKKSHFWPAHTWYLLTTKKGSHFWPTHTCYLSHKKEIICFDFFWYLSHQKLGYLPYFSHVLLQIFGQVTPGICHKTGVTFLARSHLIFVTKGVIFLTRSHLLFVTKRGHIFNQVTPVICHKKGVTFLAISQLLFVTKNESNFWPGHT